jgi:hypothetical protein
VYTALHHTGPHLIPEKLHFPEEETEPKRGLMTCPRTDKN